MRLPEVFTRQMKQLLGNSYSDFEASLNQSSPTCIRINPNKNTNDFQLEKTKQVPWCNEGFYLPERPVFTLDPYFHAGHYYVQEPASMFIDYILKFLNVSKAINVLDLCSSPGGKSTLMLSYFTKETFLHCHEYDPFRAQILRQNLDRWGCSNTYVSQGSLNNLTQSNLKYQIILIDAPCSGEGMFRKEPDALQQWNPIKVKACSVMQQNILKIADTLCEEGGYIIYSTCTYNYQENEDQLQPYVADNRYKSIKITNPFAEEFITNNLFAYRFFPHKVNSEGLTIGLIQKEKSRNPIMQDFELKSSKKYPELQAQHWIHQENEFQIFKSKEIYYAFNEIYFERMIYLSSKLKFISSGIPLGQLKGIDFIPDHALALSQAINPNISRIELLKPEALNYLRATYTPESTHLTSKWVLATYQDATLGWFKINQNGVKNYFPKNLRIRNL